MKPNDPRWPKFWQNLIWFAVTLIVLIILFRFFLSPVILVALWIVGLGWGAFLAYRLSQILLGGGETAISQKQAQTSLTQALEYRAKIKDALGKASSATGMHPRELEPQIEALSEAVEELVERISSLRQDETIRRDRQTVPKAIKDLEKRLASEPDAAIKKQLARTLANRQKQQESLDALQTTVKRAEIQIESTLSQLGTIYSQLLTGQSTSHVADYSRLSADVDEEVRLLQDQLEALREVKLGSE